MLSLLALPFCGISTNNAVIVSLKTLKPISWFVIQIWNFFYFFPPKGMQNTERTDITMKTFTSTNKGKLHPWQWKYSKIRPIRPQAIGEMICNMATYVYVKQLISSRLLQNHVNTMVLAVIKVLKGEGWYIC